MNSPGAVAGAYRLLAEVLSGPVTADLVAQAIQSPLLAEAAAQVSLDELAAQHQHAFGWAVYCHQSVFLDPGGWEAAESVQALGALYRRAGYPARDNLPADHLSNLLLALAHCLDAGPGGEPLAWELLSVHALRWVPVWTYAVRAAGGAFPAAIAAQVEDLLRYHLEHLLEGGRAMPPFVLPPSELDLSDPDTTLGDIADYLVCPPRSGLFLSRVDIQGAGRAVGCASGFGSRRNMLLATLRTAAQHECLDSLAAGLVERYEAWLMAMEQALEGEGLALPLAPWVTRCREARDIVAALGEAATRFRES